MALPNTLNSVTVRRVSALLSGVWSKVKTALGKKIDETEQIGGVNLLSSALSSGPNFYNQAAPTLYSGDGEKFVGTSAGDSYFFGTVMEAIAENEIVTISFDVSGLRSGEYISFTTVRPTVREVHVNGRRSYTFPMNTSYAAGDTINLMDDSAYFYNTAPHGFTISNIKLERGRVATAYTRHPLQQMKGAIANGNAGFPIGGDVYTALNGIDASVVHKGGSETITGLKTFNNAVSPRQTGDSFAKQSKVFVCSVITPYADWTTAQKDGNHYRTWTIDLTSVIVASSTHGNIVIKMMGSYYSTPGNGTLEKEITFQVYNGNVVISKGNYTIAQSPCADEFEISDVFKSGSNYVIQVVNRKPTANNYPLRLEIAMFNRYASAVLDNVAVTEAITEGLPSWTVGTAQVIADRAVTLDSKWYYYNASSTPQWLKVLSVVHTGNTQSYAGDIFAVASRDAGDNNCQSLLTVSAFSYGGTTLEAKHLVLGMRTTSFGDPVFYIYRQDETHYTLYVYLTRYSGVKIAPVICGGAITYETGSYTTQPANTAPIDRFVNIFTSSGAGIGGPLLPTYVDAKGLEVPCSSSDAVIGINLVGKDIRSFDTESTPIIPNYIYFPSQTDTISGYSLNIQRLVQGKVYKLMLRDGGDSMRVKLGNYHDGGPDTFEVHHGNASGRTVNSWELPDGTHDTSYTTHIVRVDNRTVYIIDGY